MTSSPRMREVMLEGLQQAFQARIVQLWSNVTVAGEPSPGPRFTKGVEQAMKFYALAWAHIHEVTKDE
jgi:hypothetical protein